MKNEFRYIDKTTDLNGNDWFVNNVVMHATPCRNDEGKIAWIYGERSAHVRVDFGSFMATVFFSDLKLVRRRTADEVPFAAMEK